MKLPIAEKLLNHVGSGATHAPWGPGLEDYRMDLLTDAANTIKNLHDALFCLLESLPDKEGRFMPSHMKAPLLKARTALAMAEGRAP